MSKPKDDPDGSVTGCVLVILSLFGVGFFGVMCIGALWPTLAYFGLEFSGLALFASIALFLAGLLYRQLTGKISRDFQRDESEDE